MTIDAMRNAELSLIAFQTVVVFVTMVIAYGALSQARKGAPEQEQDRMASERDRLARRLSDCADVLADLVASLVLGDGKGAEVLQVRLRALLIGAAALSELPAAFDVADAQTATPDERRRALELAQKALREVRVAAQEKHQIVRGVTARAVATGRTGHVSFGHRRDTDPTSSAE